MQENDQIVCTTAVQTWGTYRRYVIRPTGCNTRRFHLAFTRYYGSENKMELNYDRRAIEFLLRIPDIAGYHTRPVMYLITIIIIYGNFNIISKMTR